MEHLLDANNFDGVISSSLVVQNSALMSGLSGSSSERPEKYEGQPRSSKVQTQYQGQQFEITCDAPIQSVVKWFNPKRRFGFVVLSDGSGDAFLHRKVLVQAGIDAVEPGAVLEVRVGREDQGLRVTEVLSFENSSTVPATQGFQKRTYRRPFIEEAGTVKSFYIKRGYGFIARAGGGKDALVHVSTLERAGLRSLSEGQRVFMVVTEGRQGPRTRSIRVVPLGSSKK